MLCHRVYIIDDLDSGFDPLPLGAEVLHILLPLPAHRVWYISGHSPIRHCHRCNYLRRYVLPGTTFAWGSPTIEKIRHAERVDFCACKCILEICIYISWRLHESSRRLRFRPGFEPYLKQLELRSTSPRAVSWTCLTLLDSPDSAVVGVDRARIVSLRGLLFLLFGSKY